MKHPLRVLAITVTATLFLGVGIASAQALLTERQPNNAPAAAGKIRRLDPIRPVRTEDVYVSVRPCRLVDTRNAGGQLANNQTRAYRVSGTANFNLQGGRAGGCGIPAGATSITTVFTAVGTRTRGYMRAYPSNQTEPAATTLSYPAGTDIGTGATLSTNPAGSISLKVTNHGGPAHLVIDVTGYTVPPISAVVNAGGGIYSGTSRVLDATRTDFGTYVVSVAPDVTGCQPIVSMHGGTYYASAYIDTPHEVKVSTWRLDPTTHLETPDDFYFSLNVVC